MRKLKLGDKVKIIGTKDLVGDTYTNTPRIDFVGRTGRISYINQRDYTKYLSRGRFPAFMMFKLDTVPNHFSFRPTELELVNERPEWEI